MRRVNRVVRQGIGVVVAAWLGSVFVAPAVAGDCPFGWRPEEAVPGIETAVSSVVIWDADGSGSQSPLLVVGGYTKISESLFDGKVAAWNGTSWQLLGSGMNDQVKALAVYNGDLIAGGLFTSAGGNTVNYIARWDGANWNHLSNGVGGTTQQLGVLALSVYQEYLAVAGRFTTAGGATGFNRVALWNGQAWQSLGSGLNGAVAALTVYDGNLFAGGGFTMIVGGSMASRIARWNGTIWESLGTGMSAGSPSTEVHSLGVYANNLVAGGWFANAGGQSCNNIAQWNDVNWSALGDGMAGDTPTVNSLTVFDGLLIAGGRFSTAGGQAAANIAQWDGANWQALDSGSNARVDALAVHGGELIAGGFFTTVGGVELAYLARWGPGCVRADMNCDQVVDMADVPGFVTALLNAPNTSGCESYLANVNGDLHSDGSPKVDGLDVMAFTDTLLGS